MPRTVRLTLAATAVAGLVSPLAAQAAPPVQPVPPLPIYTFCTVYLQPFPIFSDDVPVQPVIPRLAC